MPAGQRPDKGLIFPVHQNDTALVGDYRVNGDLWLLVVHSLGENAATIKNARYLYILVTTGSTAMVVEAEPIRIAEPPGITQDDLSKAYDTAMKRSADVFKAMHSLGLSGKIPPPSLLPDVLWMIEGRSRCRLEELANEGIALVRTNVAYGATRNDYMTDHPSANEDVLLASIAAYDRQPRPQ